MKNWTLIAIACIVTSNLGAQESHHSFVAGLGDMKRLSGSFEASAFVAYQRRDIFVTDRLNVQIGLTGNLSTNQIYHLAIGKSLSVSSSTINLLAGPSVNFHKDDMNEVLLGGIAALQNSFRLNGSWAVGIQGFFNHTKFENLAGGHMFLMYRLAD